MPSQAPCWRWHPTPGPSVRGEATVVALKLAHLSQAQRAAILDVYEQTWDEANGAAAAT